MARTFRASDGLVASGVDLAWVADRLPRVDPAAITVREAPRWFRALWAEGIAAVTMPWAIYFTPAMMDRHLAGAEPYRVGKLLVHELAHVEQLKRLGVIRHVVQYVSDYGRGRFRRLGHWEAYRQVRLEVEARGIADQAVAENILSGALRQLFALSESYPDLKANQNFMQLQEELTSTENKIGFARQHYNRATAQYNEAIAVFPANVVAGMFNFKPMEYFEMEDESHRAAPKVEF